MATLMLASTCETRDKAVLGRLGAKTTLRPFSSRRGVPSNKHLINLHFKASQRGFTKGRRNLNEVLGKKCGVFECNYVLWRIVWDGSYRLAFINEDIVKIHGINQTTNGWICVLDMTSDGEFDVCVLFLVCDIVNVTNVLRYS